MDWYIPSDHSYREDFAYRRGNEDFATYVLDAGWPHEHSGRPPFAVGHEKDAASRVMLVVVSIANATDDGVDLDHPEKMEIRNNSRPEIHFPLSGTTRSRALLKFRLITFI